MHRHRVLSLAAALFVAPFATGCMAGGEELDDEVMDVEGPGLEENVYASVPYLYCYHYPSQGMECTYYGGGNTEWKYERIGSPSASSYGWYPSGPTVNWGTCNDPGSGSASSVIIVQARTAGGYVTQPLSMPCR